MKTFAKTQVSSFMASLIDYWVTIGSVEWLRFLPVWASAFGVIAGGITNFSLNRHWVFRQGDKRAREQMFRYALVWSGYLMLATSGIFVLTHFTTLNYIIAKVMVSLVLAVSYNYPLQKKFVFR